MSDPHQAGPPRTGEPLAGAATHIRPSGPPGSFEPPDTASSNARRPAAPPAGPQRRRRSVDTSTLASLALALPWALYSLLVVGFVGLAAAAATGVDAVAPLTVAGWLLSGVLVFYRRTEIVLTRIFLRARRPTPSERERLENAWRDVHAAAGTDGAKYQLFVQDTDALNAYASSGHVVTVTRKALDAMPHHHLAAVLAHELGHHLGGHAWGNLLAYWYSLPARLLNRAMRIVASLFVRIFAVIFTIAARLPLLTIVVARIITWTLLVFAGFVLVMLMITAVQSGRAWAPPALLVFLLTPVLLPWLARRSEYRADRIAAELGYGHALIEVFEDWLRQGMDDARTHAVLRARLLSTHPALAARIKKLDAYLRKNP